jgi:tetratricopeptide (TPR) repeat protein
MIWVISQKKHDYIKSNIFLKLALEQKYEHTEYIYRLQLYNYLILEKKNKIIETFDKIITLKEKPDFNDLLLATYYNIINNNKNKALLLTNLGLKLYPKKEDFFWFKAWIKIEEWKLEEATELLNKAQIINNKNALVILNLWRISKIKYEKNLKNFDEVKARFLFKKAIELDSAEIWSLAKGYLKSLEEIKVRN